MELGMIGLGRMGGSMAARLCAAGHRVVGLDTNADSVRDARSHGVEAYATLDALTEALTPPRRIWIMLPAFALDDTLEALSRSVRAADTIIDGGNSHYRDTMRRAAQLGRAGVHYVDVGTSGGIWGRTHGYSLMIGGDPAVVEPLRPVFETLAPSTDAGWGHVGPSGAGHFVKMVHNAIEYGMMQAYAEGYALMAAHGEFDIDPAQVTAIWQSGGVVRSWLLELIGRALRDNPDLSGVAPWVDDSGEGRWAAADAIDLAVPLPAITVALQQRFRSRVENSYADRLLATLRGQFGGHVVPEG